jgi:hypothetical protein
VGRAHNPEVAGSNPAPATTKGPHKRAFCVATLSPASCYPFCYRPRGVVQVGSFRRWSATTAPSSSRSSFEMGYSSPSATARPVSTSACPKRHADIPQERLRVFTTPVVPSLAGHVDPFYGVSAESCSSKDRATAQLFGRSRGDRATTSMRKACRSSHGRLRERRPVSRAVRALGAPCPSRRPL